ncbi:MAG TPA: DUF4416 family protein, partial [Burkholderiales bacterium]|nr:DUF4416 family protein [Burkholderiales bacterium]
FAPVKLVCGVIFGDGTVYDRAKALLVEAHGPVDLESPGFAFDLTDYYESEMGPGLTRRFMSFRSLVDPGRLPDIKLGTNALEERVRKETGDRRRPVNIDPGNVSASAVVMATAKEFAHRIPLAGGIYAHLEFLFTRTDVKLLEWTYPDMRREEVRRFFLGVRAVYLGQLRQVKG